MATHPSHRGLGFRLRLALVMALVGAVAGLFGGVHWETRRDTPLVRQVFVQDYLPARLGLIVGYTQLRYRMAQSDRLASPWPPGQWLVEAVDDPGAGVWLVRFEDRLHWLWVWAASGALLLGALTLQLSKQRSPADEASPTTDHLRRPVQRPWN